MSLSSVRCALCRFETRYAPDSRVACFDVTARQPSREITLHGTVQTEWLRDRAVTAAKRTVETPITDDLTVLEEAESPVTVTTGIAPVRESPDPNAERVTEALYGAAITSFDERSAWTRIRTPDGYLGWIHSEHLAVPVGGTFEHVLATDVSGILDGPGPETVYAGTECGLCSIDGNELTIRFRTGDEAHLPADDTTELHPSHSLSLGTESGEHSAPETVVETAMQYLGTPYRWGGMTTAGIDCSGLVWMAYRLAGFTLPRDADQQRRVGIHVPREELKPGDLLFFPGHVALSLGGTDYIHADGTTGVVTTARLDDGDDDREFEMAKKLLSHDR